MADYFLLVIATCATILATFETAVLSQRPAGDSGVSAVTKIKWNITKTSGGQYAVQLSSDEFVANTWIALGLSLTPNMIHSFIISCLKNGTAVDTPVIVQSRYATQHALPPIINWGVQQRPTTDKNGCAALIPGLLSQRIIAATTAEQSDITLGSGNQTIYVLNARGALDGAGNPVYHSGRKEINLKPLKLV